MVKAVSSQNHIDYKFKNWTESGWASERNFRLLLEFPATEPYIDSSINLWSPMFESIGLSILHSQAATCYHPVSAQLCAGPCFSITKNPW